MSILLFIIIGVVLVLALSANNRTITRKGHRGRSNYSNNNTDFGFIDNSQDCNIIDNAIYNTADNNCDCGCASDDGGSCDCYSGDNSSCDCGGCNDCGGGDSGSSLN